MPERVLITGARAPAALDLARCFTAAGFETHMADCAPSRMASFSRAVTKVHRYPSPRVDLSGFAQTLRELTTSLEPRILIPTCEEVFYVAALNLPCAFAPDIATLRRLHSKYAFAQEATALGFSAPHTTRVQSAAALEPFLTDANTLVFKAEYSRFGTSALIGPSPEAVRALRPTEDAPWVVQQRIRGEEVSFYAASLDARLTAFTAYRSPWKFNGGAGYAFEPLDRALHDRLLAIAGNLAQKLIPRGQFACDVIVDGDGTPWLIECNPRATSGVHLFNRNAMLATALLGHHPEPALAASAAPKHVGPALWAYGLPTALEEARLGEWSERRRQSGDVISAPRDAAPIAGALIDTASLTLKAAFAGKTLTEMATADIEWNGEPL